MTWVRQKLSQLTIVRQNQKPSCIDVQTPNREHAGLRWHEVKNRFPPMRVNHRCHNAFWLIQQVIHEARKYANWCAIDLNDVSINIHSTTKYRYVTININATIFNQVLTHTP
jgi:hypothetical protein